MTIQMIPNSRYGWLYIPALILLLFSSATINADQPLPDLGGIETSLSQQLHEKKIAEQVMRNLRHADLVIEDPEITDYIQSIGKRLTSHAEWQGQEFNFFVVNSLDINAFALPAGYIGINSGLILTTQSEAELASVVAHEIAHITQHHYSRREEMAKEQNYLLAAAILASIAVSQNNGGDAGMALLMGSMATSVQHTLEFSRENEKEADWLGLKLMQESGFKPQGMVDFFKRMHQAYVLSGVEVPEFFSTHPLTLKRISEAASRVEELQYENNNHASYHFIWHRLASLYGEQSRRFPPLNSENVSGLKEYITALDLRQQGKPQQALKYLQRAYRANPTEIAIRLELARAQLDSDQTEVAQQTLAELYELFPTQYSIVSNYVDILHQNKEYTIAETILTQYLRRQQSIVPYIYRQMADIKRSLGKLTESHSYLAEYYFSIGRSHDAIRQLEIALSQTDMNFYQKERISSRLSVLQEHVKNLANLTKVVNFSDFAKYD